MFLLVVFLASKETELDPKSTVSAQVVLLIPLSAATTRHVERIESNDDKSFTLAEKPNDSRAVSRVRRHVAESSNKLCAKSRIPREFREASLR